MKHMLTSAIVVFCALGVSAHPTDSTFFKHPRDASLLNITDATKQVHSRAPELHSDYIDTPDEYKIDSSNTFDTDLDLETNERTDYDDDDDEYYEDRGKTHSKRTKNVFTAQSTVWDLWCKSGGYASELHIKKGIDQIRQREGQPTVAPGACERLFCERGSGIKWCNSNSVYGKTLPTYRVIANGAAKIVRECPRPNHMTRGYLIYNEFWSIIVEKDKC
ncbi:hypothetical protein BJX64DRAFT_290593 [Aspergillus heterothallicus]